MEELKTRTSEEFTFKQKIFRRKTPEQLVEKADQTGLKRNLSAIDLIILGVGAVIGAGIFTLSGTAAAGSAGHLGAGPGLVVSFLIAAIACSLAALSYSELSSMIPVAGSAYAYTFATIGELFAWLMGWILILEYIVGSIVVACGWSGYLIQTLKGMSGILPAWLVNPPLWLIYDYWTAAAKYQELGLNPAEYIPNIGGLSICLNLPAMLIVIVMTSILYIGIKESTKFATAMVVTKLVVILAFIGVGAFYVKPENWTPFFPNGWQGVAAGAFMVFVAYIGFDAVSTAAEETKNPQKNLPIGLIGTLIACSILYISVSAVLTGMVPWDSIDTHAPVAVALTNVNQNMIAGLISIGAVAGLTSVLLVMQMGGSRVLFAMSRDKLLPASLARVHKKFKTPHVITLTTGILIALGTIVLDINRAAELCNIGTLTAFMMVCIAVLILRIKEPNRKRVFKVPYAYITCPLGALVCFSLIYMGMPVFTLIVFGIWVMLGLILYFSYGFLKAHD